MLQLTGLNLNAKLYGTVVIFAIPYESHYPGATVQKRLVIQTSGGTELIAEDQIIQAEVK